MKTGIVEAPSVRVGFRTLVSLALCAVAAGAAMAHVAIDVVGDYALTADSYDHLRHGSRDVVSAVALVLAVVLAARGLRLCCEIASLNRSRILLRVPGGGRLLASWHRRWPRAPSSCRRWSGLTGASMAYRYAPSTTRSAAPCCWDSARRSSARLWWHWSSTASRAGSFHIAIRSRPLSKRCCARSQAPFVHRVTISPYSSSRHGAGARRTHFVFPNGDLRGQSLRSSS